MSGPKLREAADRLAGLAKSIKADQLTATGAGGLPHEDAPILHPQEAWARQFAVHAMRAGRDLEVGPPPLSSFAAPIAEVPRIAPRSGPVSSPPPDARISPALGPGSGHIGGKLGKPGPRASWLARLFRGR